MSTSNSSPMSQPEFERRRNDPSVSPHNPRTHAVADSGTNPGTSPASHTVADGGYDRSRGSSTDALRQSLRQDLQSAINACRQSTLALLDLSPATQFQSSDGLARNRDRNRVGHETESGASDQTSPQSDSLAARWDVLCRQSHLDFSPVGWHMGHIVYTEALWILERLAGQPPIRPDFHHLFAADGLPKAERQKLPDWLTLQDYMETVRQRVFEYLAIAPVDRQERLWRFLLQHESQHCETMALVLALHQRKAAIPNAMELVSGMTAPANDPTAVELPKDTMVFVAPGAFDMGNDSAAALDNERPCHRAQTPGFWIDRYPVTCGDFRRFIEAGGYRHAEWWSDAGWQWFQCHPVSSPLYWVNDSAWDDHPVSGVSWYEADAYARFAGKRLPTEIEWEKAARWQPQMGRSLLYPWGEDAPSTQYCNHHHWVGHTTPVTAYETVASPVGCVDMLGNVWEWTSSLFQGYSEFQPFPYRGYSQAYFDGQHYVMRGGSWATRPWALRSSFRNWYHPWMRQMFVGFRCAMDG